MKLSTIEIPSTCDDCGFLACARIDYISSEGPQVATLCLPHAQVRWRALRDSQQNESSPATPLPGRTDAPTDTPSARPSVTHRPPRAIDGDTIEEILPCGCVRRIRLLGIDAPERGSELGAESAAALTEWIEDAGLIGVEADAAHPTHDRYGRMLAWCISPRAGNASVDQARCGLARYDERFPPGAHGDQVRAAEGEARAARRGIWRQTPT